MKLNRFFRPRSRRGTQRILKSATVCRPVAIEPLEERQLMSLTIEIKTASGGSTATVTSVGQVVNMDIYAVISGKESGSTDGLISVCGSILSTETSSANSVAGNLLDSVNANDYGASGAQEGTQQDLNGDGNLDVGSNNNSEIAGFMNARAGYLQQNGVISGDTQTFEIATLTYTVTNLHYGSATDINFRLRDGLGAGSFDAVWQEDGVGKNDGPNSGTVLIGAPVVVTDPNLTPPPTGTISGSVSQVSNGVTTPLAGATVYLDANDTGSLTSSDIKTTTSSTGAYSITGLLSGTYYLREVVPSGYTQTTPSSSPTIVSLATDSSSVTGENFVDTAVVVKTASIAGTVSKVVSGTTSAFSGVTVDLDLNNTFLTSATTSSTGTYSFTGLAAGTYEVSETVPSGYTQTSPTASSISLTLTTGQAATSENFTDTAAATTSGSLLTGTVIGTSGSYQNDGNTIAKAFDGNLSTYYDGASANGDWAGLNLSNEYTITQVSYSPRPSWAARMVGGVFQGSNDPTFTTGVTTLATITSTPTVGVYATVPITSTSSFEYVRYLSPSGSYGDVAELQFYGNVVKTTNAGLTGTVIGTSGSYQNDGNTIAKAFDGNLSTFFDGPTANGNWAGLNLGAKYTITSINYAPRTSWAARMVGGIFQGSNDPTFTTGVVTLATITAAPTVGVYTTVTVSNTGGYQYVRYLSPSGSYGDVADIQFFGTLSTSTTTPLTGTVIGTSGSYQNDGNTIAKAFDGNLSTFFDGPTANGNWAGLDLGTAQTITQISYAPRASWAARMVGGIFQASNSATFSTGVVNLYTITATPPYNTLTTVAVNVTGTYRYVRYLSPSGSYGDVSEILFYG